MGCQNSSDADAAAARAAELAQARDALLLEVATLKQAAQRDASAHEAALAARAAELREAQSLAASLRHQNEIKDQRLAKAAAAAQRKATSQSRPQLEGALARRVSGGARGWEVCWVVLQQTGRLRWYGGTKAPCEGAAPLGEIFVRSGAADVTDQHRVRPNRLEFASKGGAAAAAPGSGEQRPLLFACGSATEKATWLAAAASVGAHDHVGSDDGGAGAAAVSTEQATGASPPPETAAAAAAASAASLQEELVDKLRTTLQEKHEAAIAGRGARITELEAELVALRAADSERGEMAAAEAASAAREAAGELRRTLRESMAARCAAEAALTASHSADMAQQRGLLAELRSVAEEGSELLREALAAKAAAENEAKAEAVASGAS